MAAGWENGDRQTQERRNREWIGRYISGLPVPDLDDAGVPQVLPRAMAFAVTNVETVHGTFPPGALIVVHRISLTNTSDVAHQAWVAVHDAAFTQPDAIVRTSTIQPREQMLFEGPWFAAGGATVRSFASTALAGQLAGRIDFSVFKQPTPGLTAVFARVALSATPAVLYTAPAGIHSAYVAALGVTSHGATDYTTTPILELLPAGQATSPRFYLANAAMPAAETEIIGGYTLQPGDAIRAWRTGVDPITLALNVIEFRG